MKKSIKNSKKIFPIYWHKTNPFYAKNSNVNMKEPPFKDLVDFIRILKTEINSDSDFENITENITNLENYLIGNKLIENRFSNVNSNGIGIFIGPLFPYNSIYMENHIELTNTTSWANMLHLLNNKFR